MKVTVDEALCCGAGSCAMLASEVFDQNADGIVMLLDAQPPEQLHATVREAAEMCPTAAIEVSERG